MNIIDKVYVVNLDRRFDRYENFIKNVCLKSQFIKEKHVRYSAIDGQKLSENELFEITSVRGKNFMLNNSRSKGIYLTKGAIGLALTYKKIIEDCRGITMILEDDVNIIENFDSELSSCLNNLPDDWDVLYLGWCDSRYLKIEKFNNYINLLNGQINGTHGWIINPNGKNKLLSVYPLTYQIDTEIYKKNYIKKYSTYKKIALRTKGNSDIQT